MCIAVFPTKLVYKWTVCSTNLANNRTRYEEAYTISLGEFFDTQLALINEDLIRICATSADHCLTINAEKSAVMFVGRHKVSADFEILIENQKITASNTLKNLDVTFEPSLRYSLHVSQCIWNGYATLKMIYSNRRVLNYPTKSLLCQTLVLSKLNHCDVLYNASLRFGDTKKIQVLQNSCLRLMFGIRRGAPITHKRKDIGWLDMKGERKLKVTMPLS